MEGYTIVRGGMRQYAEMNGVTYFSRRIGTKEWNEVEKPPPLPTALELCPTRKLKLSLVREDQSEGEPLHWFLFLHDEDSFVGMAYQVTGDATYMHYSHEEKVDLSSKDSFRDHYEIATLSKPDAEFLHDVAHQELPPSAPTRALVTENCQGWTLRVIRALVDRGIVTQTWYTSLASLKDPI